LGGEKKAVPLASQSLPGGKGEDNNIEVRHSGMQISLFLNKQETSREKGWE
jgi:hypothetical protein